MKLTNQRTLRRIDHILESQRFRYTLDPPGRTLWIHGFPQDYSGQRVYTILQALSGCRLKHVHIPGDSGGGTVAVGVFVSIEAALTTFLLLQNQALSSLDATWEAPEAKLQVAFGPRFLGFAGRDPSAPGSPGQPPGDAAEASEQGMDPLIQIVRRKSFLFGFAQCSVQPG